MTTARNPLRDAHPDWFHDQQGREYVLYRGLLALAHERGLKDITVTLVQIPSELNGMTAICSASAQMPGGTFTDIGDASPTNVNRMIAAHLIRMASTRAKARALRDAVNVGVTAFEELGEPGSGESPAGTETAATRRPSVAVQGARKVDEDAGRGTAAPRPAQPGPYAPGGAAGEWPGAGGATNGALATPKQRETLHKFGHRDLPDGLTRARASEMISDAIARKGGQ